MNHLRTILAALLFAAAPAAAQTIKTLGYNTTNGNVVAATNLTFTNSLNFATNARAVTRTNLGGTTTGNAVFTATNAAAAANAIGLGATNSVQFGSVAISSDEMVLNGASINSVGFGGELNFEERKLAQGGTNIFDWGSAPGFVVTPSTSFLTNVTVNGNVTTSGTLTATGNVTMAGTGNTAPNQTASSGSSLMTRDLSDDRYSFSRWYTAYDLLAGDITTGAQKTLQSGAGSSAILDNWMVAVPNENVKFNLPVDWRISGEVKVVSYWSDRGATNVGGTNADIAVFVQPFTRNPTNNTALAGAVGSTVTTNIFTANYGGPGNSRIYVVEQTVNFGAITNISGTNPMQVKFVELQRRGTDATDTSTNNIWLSGVHIYVP